VQQLNSFCATEERDVYSHERPAKDLAPLGVKPGSGTVAEQAEAVALLRSFGVKNGPRVYKYLAPLGRRVTDILLHFQRELASVNGNRYSDNYHRSDTSSAFI
jgi:hypothetical protein